MTPRRTLSMLVDGKSELMTLCVWCTNVNIVKLIKSITMNGSVTTVKRTQKDIVPIDMRTTNAIVTKFVNEVVNITNAIAKPELRSIMNICNVRKLKALYTAKTRLMVNTNGFL